MSEQHPTSLHHTAPASEKPTTFAQPDPVSQGLLQQTLRTQLNELLAGVTTEEERLVKLRQSFTDIANTILSEKEVAYETLLKQFETLYENAMLSLKQADIPEQLLTQQFISKNGLIMSPLNCSNTIKDVFRVSSFTRGLLRAIEQQLESKETVRVLYPACGTFAPLIVPLLSYVKEHQQITHEQLKVTFVDLQPGAIKALKQLVSDLELEEYIDDIVMADATEYEPDFTVDILLLEAMQHGFGKEAHLSIAHHLIRFLDINGTMVPNRIVINSALVVGAEEFKEQWQDVEYSHSKTVSQEYMDRRVELGSVMSIDKNSLMQMEKITLSDDQQLIRGATINIPTGIEDIAKRTLILYASIQTFANESIHQYDSGITSPLPDTSICIDFKPRDPRPGDLLVSSGDDIAFFYRLNGLPGFMPVLESQQ
ncbi:hypothetical protein [Planctobacterium marinum]|uniref:Uncharacterized protein n=1 Tax=Planctobacterium marinum TaxID=1631968 RepID=A0AA48HK43_9ALTE|nr:hypothetical protein MACH26_34170 [Planctobacterium marinum]